MTGSLGGIVIRKEMSGKETTAKVFKWLLCQNADRWHCFRRKMWPRFCEGPRASPDLCPAQALHRPGGRVGDGGAWTSREIPGGEKALALCRQPGPYWAGGFAGDSAGSGRTSLRTENRSWAGWIADFPLSFTRCDVGPSNSSLSLSFLTCKMGVLLHGIVWSAGRGAGHVPLPIFPGASALCCPWQCLDRRQQDLCLVNWSKNHIAMGQLTESKRRWKTNS